MQMYSDPPPNPSPIHETLCLVLLPMAAPLGMSREALSRVKEASLVVKETRDRDAPPPTAPGIGEAGGFFSLSTTTRVYSHCASAFPMSQTDRFKSLRYIYTKRLESTVNSDAQCKSGLRVSLHSAKASTTHSLFHQF